MRFIAWPVGLSLSVIECFPDQAMALDKEMAETNDEIAETKAKIAKVEAEIAKLKGEVKETKEFSDLSALLSELTDLRSELTALRSDLTALRCDRTALRNKENILLQQRADEPSKFRQARGGIADLPTCITVLLMLQHAYPAST
jgi:septal ring factor EnvC (AmiA/AmiB activator)